MSNNKYKSIHLNVPRKKFKDLITWLEERSVEEDRTLNSFIIRLLKKEYDRYEEKQDEE